MTTSPNGPKGTSQKKEGHYWPPTLQIGANYFMGYFFKDCGLEATLRTSLSSGQAAISSQLRRPNLLAYHSRPAFEGAKDIIDSPKIAKFYAKVLIPP